MRFAGAVVRFARTFGRPAAGPLPQTIKATSVNAIPAIGAAVACGGTPSTGRQRRGANDAYLVGATASAVLRPPSRFRPIGRLLRRLDETKAVAEMQYEIVFRLVRAAKAYRRYAFCALRGGRTVGRLDVDFIASRKWLYVANIHVVEAHGNRGVGTALLVCAARRTACEVLTTSSRTRQGAAFFAKNRATLKRYGVETADRPPAPALPPDGAALLA